MNRLEHVVHAVENSLRPIHQLKGCPPQIMSLDERMAYHNVPGFSIALIDQGEIAWVQG